MPEPKTHPSVLIIGAGFGGIAMAIELRKLGIRDVTILEAADGPGGTWRYNTYPGAACDIPSQMYSFSFAQRRDWSRPCSPQPEILAYLEQVATDEGITPLIVTGSPVERCDWDADQATWTATTPDGRTFTADVLIPATGQLNTPVNAKLKGLATFAGEQFHSARWRHDLDLRGRRVAVIGTGASAVQFVPEVAGIAGHLDVYQRTGNWFLPRWNKPYPARYRWLIEHVPGMQKVRRRMVFDLTEHLTRGIRNPKTVGRSWKAVSTAYMRWQLRGAPALRKQLWPDYTWGCKRVLFTSRFIPALRRENVELVTEPIREVVPEGIVTADGALHPTDVIIHGTGFASTGFVLPMQINGPSGSLQDAWAGGPSAHLGLTVPDFPNLFVLYGPNTNTSGGSIIMYLEAQAAYVRQAVELLARSGAAAIGVRPEVAVASDAALQARFAGTAWLDCDSWYRDQTGRIVTNWPGYVADYLAAVRTLDPAEFALTPSSTPQPA
ncbi:MAG: NAD(P)/FAD-dependent oxidoreductase [Solirubrobacteraceae bacterium]|nr:NAD(P)/FAD-dependent oxidoreductase [Solirubrobacteraceae bacterium]